jgi:hypothetical protein
MTDFHFYNFGAKVRSFCAVLRVLKYPIQISAGLYVDARRPLMPYHMLSLSPPPPQPPTPRREPVYNAGYVIRHCASRAYSS